MFQNRSKIFKAISILLLVLVIAILVIGGYLIYKVYVLNDSILRKKSVQADGDALSIVLFGVDSDLERNAEGTGERSDSIVLLSINPKKNKTIMVSIPRDTRASIVGQGTVEKINHAYAYGGPKMAINSLEKLMDVPIDHYASMNMDGVRELIDQVGGVKVKSNANFTTKGDTYKKGKTYKLSGKEALAFIRSRKEQGSNGDFGRQERQQLVIEALGSKLATAGSITKINQIYDTLGNNVKTDLKITEFNSLRSEYVPATKKIEKYRLDGENKILDDNLYYFIPNTSSKEKIREKYRANLDL